MGFIVIFFVEGAQHGAEAVVHPEFGGELANDLGLGFGGYLKLTGIVFEFLSEAFLDFDAEDDVVGRQQTAVDVSTVAEGVLFGGEFAGGGSGSAACSAVLSCGFAFLFELFRGHGGRAPFCFEGGRRGEAKRELGTDKCLIGLRRNILRSGEVISRCRGGSAGSRGGEGRVQPRGVRGTQGRVGVVRQT